ncbi:MAG TPA: carbohydrate-binding protein [Cyclobacteriaceae bacterium]|nr:carbohydrate-binding protein [Cyclobacteriaceae bacterium]
MRTTLFFCFWLVTLGVSFAQDTISNPNSTEKIPYYEQLYRFRVNRVIDLGEKQNAGFNSRKSSISKLIIDLLGEGKLHTYGGNLGDPADFKEAVADTTALKMADNYVKSQTQGDWSATKDYLAGDMVIFQGNVYRVRNNITGNASNQNPPAAAALFEDLGPMTVNLAPANIVGLELIEDVIFDKRRSRLYYDILAFGIVLQDENSLEKLSYRFYISYKELMKEISRLAHSKDLNERQRVMWQNRYNPSEGKTFGDAFKLRLFHGVIRKVENPDDDTIQQIFANNGRSYSESVFARWEEEMKLMEKEHNLWEF